jgi:hypothetical protein
MKSEKIGEIDSSRLLLLKEKNEHAERVLYKFSFVLYSKLLLLLKEKNEHDERVLYKFSFVVS